MLSGERSSFRHGAAPRPPSVPRPAPAQSALAAAPFPWIRCSARRLTATRLDSRSILSRARVRFPRDGGVVAHGVKSLTGARKMVSLRFLLCTCSRRLPDLGFSCLIGSSLSYLYRISLRSFTSDEKKTGNSNWVSRILQSALGSSKNASLSCKSIPSFIPRQSSASFASVAEKCF